MTETEELKKKLDDMMETLEVVDKEIESLQSRLSECADHYADDGLITDTPYAKRLWIEKGIR